MNQIALFSFFSKSASDIIKRLVLLFSVSFYSCTLYSQDITGHWQGKSYWPGLKGDTAKVYLEINYDSPTRHFTGYSVSVYKDFYGKSLLNGYYDEKSAKYIFIEDEIVEATGRKRVNVILDKYILTVKTPGVEALYGTIQCTSNSRKIDKISWYCSNNRTVTFYKTTASIPTKIKSKAERMRLIKN